MGEPPEGYVTITALRSGSGVAVLTSPGLRLVTWRWPLPYSSENTCPNCGKRAVLPKSFIAWAVSGLTVSDTGARLVNFACECKTAFRCDSLNALLDAPDRHERAEGLRPGIATVGCSGSNCTSPVEIIAVRDEAVSSEQFRAEVREWNIEALCCERGHSASLLGQAS
jgi:hypothetical protein